MAPKNDRDPKATHHTYFNSSLLWIVYRIALGFRHNTKYTKNEQRREDLIRISSCFLSSEQKSLSSVHRLSGTHHSGQKFSVAITTRWRCRPFLSSWSFSSTTSHVLVKVDPMPAGIDTLLCFLQIYSVPIGKKKIVKNKSALSVFQNVNVARKLVHILLDKLLAPHWHLRFAFDCP